jgi:colanic acid biosynthesis glycosyl transferase WcaI
MLYWYPYEGPLMPIYGAIFQDLVTQGHDVTIVTSFPHYRKGRSETWDEYRNKLIEISTWKNLKLIRSYIYAPIFNSRGSGLIYRALNFISFNISCIIAGLFAGGKADLIFAPSSPPLTNGFCAWILGIWKKCPVIYNVQDMYPDMAEKLGLIKNKPFIALLKKLEKWVYKFTDKTLVISERMRKNLLGKKVPSKKIAVIPNFIDTNFIKPITQENSFSAKWGLNDRFVVMYAGNIGIPHGTEIIVNAAEILMDMQEIVFCLVARGEYKNKIESMAKSMNLNNVRFISPQSALTVPYIWASASVSLVTYRKGMAEYSVPSKLLAIMCSGRPAIAAADKGSETERIVRSAACGLCIRPEDPPALASAILYLFKNEEQRILMGKNGRKYVLEYFKRKNISKQYEKLFLSVTGSKNRTPNKAKGLKYPNLNLQGYIKPNSSQSF